MLPAYQLDNVRYYYDKTLALSLPELLIPAQKITTLIGENGSGKSTLLNLLALLESANQGVLKVYGETVTQKSKYELGKQIGFLPQKPYMFRGTAADNLNLALKLHNTPMPLRYKKIQQVLSQLNISHLARQQANALSGGELQKLALARALITEPKILLMDEPFSYLDQASYQLLEEFILHHVKNSDITLVFSTHNRLQGLAIADHVVSLVKGELIKSPLVNLFNGRFEKGVFKTAYLSVFVAKVNDTATHVSIDPHGIVLSREYLNSSMRNQYRGKVIAIAEEMGRIRISINAGEVFQVLITQDAQTSLQLALSDKVWVSFKANAVTVF